MKQRLTVVVARAVRAVRGLWPDRNPLRRRLDRVEAAIVAGLAVAFLALAPLLALAAGPLVYSLSSRAAHAQQVTLHRVPAVLLTAVPVSEYGYGAVALARWVASDGTPQTGTVSAMPGAKAGSTVMVWENAAGQLAGPPLRLSDVRAQAALAATLAPAGLGLVLLCLGRLAHAALERRRRAAWDADWQATGPRWTNQR